MILLELARSVFRRVNEELYRKSVNWNRPLLAGIFLFFLTKKQNRNVGYKVLCLERSIFTLDIEALIRYGERIQYLLLPLGLLKVVVRKYFSDIELTEENYHNLNNIESRKEATYTFWHKLMFLYLKLESIDAVMSCNFGYVNQQEFVRACRAHGIPVIILYKEGLGVKAHLHRLIEPYQKRRVNADLFLCYNDNIKNALLAKKIPGMNPETLHVVGIPRLDGYIVEKCERKKQITFFSFYPRDKFFYFVENREKLNEIDYLSEKFHAAVVQLAKRLPEYNIVIKTKAAKHYLKYVKDILQKESGGSCIPNIRVTSSADSVKLVRESAFVIGFNSTVLIEAILARKTIISPYFGDLFEGTSWDYFSEDQKLVNYAETVDDLERIIVREKSGSHTHPHDSESFLQDFLFKTDGRASKRVEEKIVQLVQNT